MIKVYVIREEYAETLRADDDLVGFQEYVEDGVSGNPMNFQTQRQPAIFAPESVQVILMKELQWDS